MTQPSPFKWRHFEAEIILLCVRWYVRYSLSYRDLEEMMAERGLRVDHTTIYRWVQRYAPELEKRCRPHLKACNDSWKVDETYIKVKKVWMYLYRAVDSEGNTLEFLLSPTRDAEAAKRFFVKALHCPAGSAPQTPTVEKQVTQSTTPADFKASRAAPRVINVDKNAAYPLDEGLPQVRVIVARHPAPPPDKPVRVGKRVGEWVYELFITTLSADGFLVEDVLDLYHGRGAFEAVLADEDVEEDPDRWCSYSECGQELWQIVCQWVWNLRLSLGHAMQGNEMRDIEWAPPKERPPLVLASENAPEEYGPWQWAGGAGRARGRFEASAFALQEDGTLRCPAGVSLWLSELRQENAFTQRAVYVALQSDCLGCSLREQCLGQGASGNRARRVSAVRRLSPAPCSVEPQSGILAATQWRDVAGRALRRTWSSHWRRQHVEVISLTSISQRASPPPRSPRAIRSHHRWSWHDRLARNAWWGPPQLRVTVAGVPAFLAAN